MEDSNFMSFIEGQNDFEEARKRWFLLESGEKKMKKREFIIEIDYGDSGRGG